MKKEQRKTEDEQVFCTPEVLKRTPPRKNISVRRRLNGSPVLPLNHDLPVKTVFVIRHGESKGQVAHLSGLDRKTDTSLRDCGLTEKGCGQATKISEFFSDVPVDLVVTSPLTRALHTSLLAFADKPILVHYDLREVGSKAPENVPRDMGLVLKDLAVPLGDRDPALLFDVATHRPSDWPRDYSPNVVKRDRIRRVFQWLYKERPELNIVVVCHYNVIRTAVVDGEKLKPRNAEPIRCCLYSNGELVVTNV